MLRAPPLRDTAGSPPASGPLASGAHVGPAPALDESSDTVLTAGQGVRGPNPCPPDSKDSGHPRLRQAPSPVSPVSSLEGGSQRQGLSALASGPLAGGSARPSFGTGAAVCLLAAQGARGGGAAPVDTAPHLPSRLGSERNHAAPRWLSLGQRGSQGRVTPPA